MYVCYIFSLTKNAGEFILYVMEKLKVYLDTSVVSYLKQDDAPERMAETLQFLKIENLMCICRRSLLTRPRNATSQSVVI